MDCVDSVESVDSVDIQHRISCSQVTIRRIIFVILKIVQSLKSTKQSLESTIVWPDPGVGASNRPTHPLIINYKI